MLEAGNYDIQDLTGLEYCVNLSYLYLNSNNISDISALVGLTNLRSLYLSGNNISDISPLVENSGLSNGDRVDLRGSPLSTTSMDVYIPQLEAKGVYVIY